MKVCEMDCSRRSFLKASGKVAAGAALLSMANPVLAALGEGGAETPAYPFPYAKLDPEAVEKRGYDGYYQHGGCAGGVADALIGQLADTVGYPFNQIPVGLFANGAAGYGAATLCGSLGGAVAAIGLVCEAADSRAIVAELFAWYRTAEFPLYTPNTPSETTVANSVNCLESVGNYMAKTGYAMADDGRKERCAGVTADVAKKTAELLNAHFGL